MPAATCLTRLYLVPACGPPRSIVRLFDYFYYKVCGWLHPCGTCTCGMAWHRVHGAEARGELYAALAAPMAALFWPPASPQEHLFLVCELLRANLYEFQK